MNLNGLHFPRPADPNSLPALPSTSSSSTSHPSPHAALQSRSYASQRQEARSLRQDRRKSPFVPRTSHASTPHSLALLSHAQLEDRLERTTRLLDTGGAAQLPGGDARLRDQHDRILARLAHLRDLDQIRNDLADTRLDGPIVPAPDAMLDVKVAPTPVDDEAASPSAKRRIAAAAFLKNSGPTPGSSSSASPSGTAALSLHDSLALQRRAAALDRARAERRALRAAAIGAPGGAATGKGKGVASTGDELDPDDDGGMFGGILFPTGNDTDDSLSESEADDWLRALAGARGPAGQGGAGAAPARAGAGAGKSGETTVVGRGKRGKGGRARAGAPSSTGPNSASASGLSTPSRGGAFLDPDDDDDDDDDDALLGELETAGGGGGGGGDDDKYDEVNGALLDDDEDAQLNPLRTAYMQGWERAVKEEQEG
ncbi:hypothetical protein JCM3775_007128 [Rhodotorula graminis]